MKKTPDMYPADTRRENEHTPTLIVSYSYSGNTHRIAGELQAIIGSEREEIYPWQPYPMAFPELLAQVKQELAANYRPQLLPTSHHPKSYPVIFVGSPNWCGTIAPPIASWLYRNELSGKIILPFYSHCGGASGDIRGEIKKLCPKAEVKEALGICADEEGNLKELLCNWLKSAGIITEAAR